MSIYSLISQLLYYLYHTHNSFSNYFNFVISGGCNEILIGDLLCDDHLNTPECNYDGDDCCNDAFMHYSSCSECICYYHQQNIKIEVKKEVT